ncbi:uncharacterized protein LOC144706473 [Wolffia australiana]
MAGEERRQAPVVSAKLRVEAAPESSKRVGKFSRDISRLAALAAPRHRPERAFGTVRSTNVNIHRPVAAPVKILKHSNPKKKSPTTAKKTVQLQNQDQSAEKISNKSVIQEQSNQAEKKIVVAVGRKPIVRFQDQDRSAAKSGSIQKEAPRTPRPSTRPILPGTPFFSAKSCHNCRFDKLESASYWLSQIKLAESAGKHFVSAAFFRLAIDCNAEPIRNLKSELRQYLIRHGDLAIETAWKEISSDYGLINKEPDCGSINLSISESEPVISEEISLQKSDEPSSSDFENRVLESVETLRIEECVKEDEIVKPQTDGTRSTAVLVKMR